MDICIVDDVVENGTLVRRVLSNYTTSLFTDPREALEHVGSHDVDILITDQKMPGMTGLELIRRVRLVKPDVVAIIVSAFTEREDLIEAVNAQLAFRYLVKPFSLQELRDSVASAAARLERRRTEARMSSELAIQNRILLEENDTLRAGTQPILDLFAGGDPAMARIKELAMLYALSDEPVLITGETGTGKELLARIVHHFSPRRDKPFVAVNCSNLNEHLLESTLFGHARGAFTGAGRDKQGLVQEAHEGTLFLDEIGDLPPHLQPKILRFIQFQTFTPVGATGEHHVDVRIVSATNQNLRKMTEDGAFRTDLYYRLNTFQIHLPPLRQRRLDIVPIMRRIARARGSELPPVTDDARVFLEQHDFPGNARELQNIVQRLLLLVHQHDVHTVTRTVLEQALSAAMHRDSGEEIVVSRPAPGEQIDLRSVVREVERALIREVHAQEDGNVSRSAQRLGLSRQGLRNKLQSMDEPNEVEDLRDDA